MKILYLCTFYHRALLFRQQMDALSARGFNVKAFSSAAFGEGIAEKFIPIMDDVVKHHECWNKLDRLLFFPRQWKIERLLVKDYDLRSFDLLHAHLMLSSGYTAKRMKQRYGLPYVVSVRETDLTGFIQFPAFKNLAVRIMNEADGIMFLSQTHKARLINLFQKAEIKHMIMDKSVVIGNCIERFWEDHTIKNGRKLERDRALRILCVAKIRPVKNITTAAESVELLNQRGIQAFLTVVGENQDNAEYERLNKYPHTQIYPFQKKEELIYTYRSHDVFILPSHKETFGRVYVEAMTQGLPVLYTKGEGFDGNFPDGQVGFSVPSSDPAYIADRIVDIASDYERISDQCIKQCSKFYEDAIIDQLGDFYKRAVTHSQGATTQ